MWLASRATYYYTTSGTSTVRRSSTLKYFKMYVLCVDTSKSDGPQGCMRRSCPFCKHPNTCDGSTAVPVPAIRNKSSTLKYFKVL